MVASNSAGAAESELAFAEQRLEYNMRKKKK